MTNLKTIVSFLDRELKIDTFEDSSNNGLQVANSGTVQRVCCGVDASQAFFEEAAARKADLVICHHGLSWGDSLKRLTDLNYARVAALIRNDIALYAAHLPLDAHPRHGNNAVLFSLLGLRERKPFGEYHGNIIGFKGVAPGQITRSAFKKQLQKITGQPLQGMDFGPGQVTRVAIVSGGGSDMIPQAAEQGIDTYVSGEPTLPAYHMAREYGMNVIYAGHYATEVFGVRALAGVIAKRFSVTSEFIDMGVPF